MCSPTGRRERAADGSRNRGIAKGATIAVPVTMTARGMASLDCAVARRGVDG